MKIKTILKEHIRKILLEENNTIFIPRSFAEAIRQYLERNSIKYRNGRPVTGKDAFEIEKRRDYTELIKIFKNNDIDFTVAESVLKENNEEEQIAIDLIDYMGKQLPRMNWKMDKRIVGFFQELGMNVNDPQVAKIYQTALRLNR